MYAQKILRRILLSTLLISLLGYIGYKVYTTLSAPSIEVYYPSNGELVDPVFEITGRVQRADKIYLFDREIYTDEKGYFKEVMIATDNYTEIKIRASNRWKRASNYSIVVENIRHRE